MKRTTFYLTSIILLFSNLVVNAQKGEHSQDRWEKYRSEKVRFLTDNLDLTPSEAEKFWPVYNMLEKQRRDAQKVRREMEQKVRDAENLSDKEIIDLTREFTGTMEKEGALLVKYNEEFLKVLPPEKVLTLYKTETEFRMHMIKMYRDRGKKERKQ